MSTQHKYIKKYKSKNGKWVYTYNDRTPQRNYESRVGGDIRGTFSKSNLKYHNLSKGEKAAVNHIGNSDRITGNHNSEQYHNGYVRFSKGNNGAYGGKKRNTHELNQKRINGLSYKVKTGYRKLKNAIGNAISDILSKFGKKK